MVLSAPSIPFLRFIHVEGLTASFSACRESHATVYAATLLVLGIGAVAVHAAGNGLWASAPARIQAFSLGRLGRGGRLVVGDAV